MYEDLIKFVCLVDSGSFTVASEKLHISQPALSVAIKKLENSFHTELLKRAHKSFSLTTEGQIVYQHALKTKLNIDNLKLDLELSKSQKKTLRVGLIDSIAESLFIQSNDFFSQLSQQININLVINNSSSLINQLSRQELDIICITKSIKEIKGSYQIGSSLEPFVFITSKTNKVKVLQDLKNNLVNNFLSYNLNSNTAKIVDDFFSQENVLINKSFFSTSPQLILQLIVKDYGATFLPFQLITPYLGELVIIPINKTKIFYRPIDIFCLDHKLIKQYGLYFLDQLQITHRELNQSVKI